MKKLIVAAVVLVGTFSQVSMAGDAVAGKAKAATICGACHGVNGMAIAPSYPNLAGQNEAYLVSALKAYKGGERNNPIMKPMADMLSDDDVANVAAYYASLK